MSQNKILNSYLILIQLIYGRKKYGKIPIDSIVLIKTNVFDKEFNGWDEDALEFLFEGRNITGIGHDQIKEQFPDSQKKYLYNKMYITQTGTLDQNAEYGNLVQIKKLTETMQNEEWQVDIQTIIPQVVCSTPQRLVTQWWTMILILLFLLGLIALIWYCCLRRFDKYNKEEFHLQNWETRNQEQVYFDKSELNIPLQEIVQNKK